MRKRISESIQAKTFLSMLALLVVCCIIIYGMVMIFLPRNYHTELEGQVTSDFYDLVDILERNGWEASSDSLLEFSMTNNASVEISDDIGNSLFSVNYADMEKMGPDRKFCVNADKLSSRKEEQLRGFFGQDTARLNSAYPPVFRGEKRYARAA